MHRVHRGGERGPSRLLEIGGEFGFLCAGPRGWGEDRGDGQGRAEEHGRDLARARRAGGVAECGGDPDRSRGASRGGGADAPLKGLMVSLRPDEEGLAGLRARLRHPGATAAARPTVHRRATRAAPRVF